VNIDAQVGWWDMLAKGVERVEERCTYGGIRLALSRFGVHPVWTSMRVVYVVDVMGRRVSPTHHRSYTYTAWRVGKEMERKSWTENQFT